ncbi:MAG: MliC family protein [Syntrophales bacterium]|jgi:membrane-bound inhibitor of C-type lysozyme|nr:MliC family protein [Syntrophales bacterium]
MNIRTILAKSAVILMILSVTDCTCPRKRGLEVSGGDPVIYRCEKGGRIVARYYSLSDKSLDFVKVTMPDGRQYTLPQVVSGSGVRYTDERVLVWWTKGNFASVQMRDTQGKWRMLYDNCRKVPSGRPE